MVGLVETKRRAKPFVLASIYLPGEDEGDNTIPDNLRQAIDHCTANTPIWNLLVAETSMHTPSNLDVTLKILEAKNLLNSFFNKA
jgi:hypothetical protein